jgi:exopolysaccharide production protein ExoQ
MQASLAAIAYALVIVGLFWLDRSREKTSTAVWVAVVWFMLASSRSVSQWLGGGALMSAADQLMEGNATDRNVYTALVVVALIVLLTRRARVGKLLRANLPIVIFFLYCLVSMLWSDYPDIGFKRWIKAVGDFLMILVVLSDKNRDESVRKLLARSAYVLVPLSVLFIKYYPELGKVYGRWDYEAHYTGVSTNKNTLGAICLLFGLATLWRLVTVYLRRGEEGRTRQLIAQAIVLGMILWLFHMANSMTSLACFLLASPIIVLGKFRSVKRRPILMTWLVASVVCLAVAALFIAPSMLSAVNRDPTLTDRTAVWSTVLSLSGNPLVGVGFESFWLGSRLKSIWRVFSWGPGEAHNGYLEIFLSLGFVGIVLLAVVLVAGYRNAVGAWRRGVPGASLMVAYVAVGLIYNCTEAGFFRMMAPVWVCLLLAISARPEERAARPSQALTFGDECRTDSKRMRFA